MSEDPEHARIEELLSRLRVGRVTEAETEELRLWAEHDPALPARIESSAREGRLGDGWLARVEADRKLAAIEDTRTVRIEHGLGVVMLLGGFAVPIAGPWISGLGGLLLLWSFIRIRLKTHSSDPYKDVKQ